MIVCVECCSFWWQVVWTNSNLYVVRHLEGKTYSTWFKCGYTLPVMKDATVKAHLFVSKNSIPRGTTLPETNTSHLKMDGWNTILSFWGPAYFQGPTQKSRRWNARPLMIMVLRPKCAECMDYLPTSETWLKMKGKMAWGKVFPSHEWRILEAIQKSLHIFLEPQGQPFINSCFNWMIPNLYIGNGWKSPNIHF